jgi:hypothetical protein
MKTEAKFSPAGCPVCVNAEQMIVDTIDPERSEVEIVYLGEESDRINEAEGSWLS